MSSSRGLLLPALGLALACGLVLARSTPAHAPDRHPRPRAEVEGPVPSDRYLDLGAGSSRCELVPAYRRPLHRWQTERRPRAGFVAPPLDETRYVDLGAFRAGGPPFEEREP